MGIFDSVSKAVRGVTKKVKDTVSKYKPTVQKVVSNVSKKIKTSSKKVKENYTSLDKALGGALPGGVTMVQARTEKLNENVDAVRKSIKNVSSAFTDISTSLQKDKSVRQSVRTEERISRESDKVLEDVSTFNPLEIFDADERRRRDEREEVFERVSDKYTQNQALQELINADTINQQIRDRAVRSGYSQSDLQVLSKQSEVPTLESNKFNFDETFKDVTKVALLIGGVWLGAKVLTSTK
jgi:hypothetical protein